MTSKPFCYHTPDQVRESGLLAPERMQAILSEIESRISPVFDDKGNQVSTSRIARFSYGSFVYPRLSHEHDWEYMRRELMADILTADELKLINDYCLSASSAAKERERFEKATKLDKWDGWVTDGDQYWDSVESYLDECRDEIENEEGVEYALPLYLWVAPSQQVIPHLDVSDVVEHWITDRGWEDCDLDAFSGVETLQAALDAFVTENRSVVSYTPDYTRAVLLNGYIEASKADAERDRIASL